jgi:hypothetical protein
MYGKAAFQQITWLLPERNSPKKATEMAGPLPNFAEVPSRCRVVCKTHPCTCVNLATHHNGEPMNHISSIINTLPRQSGTERSFWARNAARFVAFGLHILQST